MTNSYKNSTQGGLVGGQLSSYDKTDTVYEWVFR